MPYGAPPPPPPPAYGLGAAAAALGAGILTFLYVGMVGGRAAAEVVLGLLGVTVLLAAVAFGLGIQDLRRKQTRRGVITLVLAGLPILIVATGMLLDKLHRDSLKRDYARPAYEDDDRARSKSGDTKRAGGTSGPVRVEVYTMSQCPYCLLAEAALHDVASTLGDDVNIQVLYIGKRDAASGTLSSMHGPDELTGDLAQVCAAKLSTKLFDFIACQNQDNAAVGKNWRTCAPSAGIPVDKLEACINGAEGKELLAASFQASEAKGVRAAPTIFIAGKQHQGPRQKNDLLRAICAAYAGDEPAACASVPKAPEVRATILGDARCAACDLGKASSYVKLRASNPVIDTLDYASPEGKALYQKLALGDLPVIVLDASLDADADAAAAFAKSAKPVGDRRVVQLGAWNPTCADEGGCARAECKSNAACARPPTPAVPTPPR
jgi:glutaredoxin